MARLKDIPKFDRPREKFLEKGADALTDSELLAILLGSGIKGTNVKVLAQKIIKKSGNNLLNITVEDLKSIKGIGAAKAVQIASVLALAKRMYEKQTASDNLILSARDAIALVPELRDKRQEHLVCLYLNARNALIKKEIISIGTLDKSLIHPRDIFGLGLELRAANVILIHNHPSGNPDPSEEDRKVAKRIVESGHLLGVNVSDFIIVAKNGNHSVLGELQNTKLTDTEYIAEGMQISLFDLLVDYKQTSFYENDFNCNKIDNKNNNNSFKFIDLFAGIGGFRLAFSKQGGECVFTSEIDKNCQDTYCTNFGNLFVNGDIKKIDENNIPYHDILVAGFPCQPFSISGKMKGFDDTRGTLFFDILRIIKVKKPRILLLENVKHLVHHNRGKTLETMLKHLKELGYLVEWKILNASDFGVPQNRERIVIIACKNKPFDFNMIRTKPHTKLSEILDTKGEFEYLDSSAYTLIKKPITQPSGLIFVGYRNKGIRTKGVRLGTEHLSRVHKQPNRIYSAEGIHPTLPSQEMSGRFWILYKDKVRKLTKNECRRLMGFPNDYKFISRNGEFYKQIGNSVVIPMVEELAYQIKKQLL